VDDVVLAAVGATVAAAVLGATVTGSGDTGIVEAGASACAVPLSDCAHDDASAASAGTSRGVSNRKRRTRLCRGGCN
jgi:hypothetical protein